MNRRNFIKWSLAHSLGAAGLSSTVGALATAKAALNVRGGLPDYRALVCVYLYGGNDSYNMLIPRDDSRYATYLASRGNSLAIPQADLLAIDDSAQGAFGLHPACSALHSLYNQNNLSIISNTGTLIQPTTQQDYANGVGLPRHLFSHNSQQDQSMTARPQQDSRSGWAGRIADLLHAGTNNDALVPFNLSVGGQNLLQVGAQSTPVIVGPGGMPTFDICDLANANSLCASALHDSLQQALAQNNALIRGHGRVFQRSHELSTAIDTALQGSVAVNPNLYPIAPQGFPGNPDLSLQLQMVTRLISVAQSLGHQRSIFFVSLGGWDTHDNQLINHDLLLSNLSQNLAALYQQLVDFGLSDQVLTFTSSDFGRTLTSNGDGSDHGWGGNQLVIGSQNNLAGGALYGTFPNLALGSEDDADLGRIIPTTPLDAYYATLVRWLGVQNEDMLDVFPNLVHFGGATTDMGFLS